MLREHGAVFIVDELNGAGQSRLMAFACEEEGIEPGCNIISQSFFVGVEECCL